MAKNNIAGETLQLFTTTINIFYDYVEGICLEQDYIQYANSFIRVESTNILIDCKIFI